MVCCRKKMFGIIGIFCFYATRTSTASALGAVFLQWRTFDISFIRDSNQHFIIGNHVFDAKFARCHFDF